MPHTRFAGTDISDEDLEKLKETAASLKEDVMSAFAGTEMEDQVAGFFELFMDALSRRKKMGHLRSSLVPIFNKVSALEGAGGISEEKGQALRGRISEFLKAVTAASGRKMYDHEEYKKKLEERKRRLYEQGKTASAELCGRASHICSRLGRLRRIMETVV